MTAADSPPRRRYFAGWSLQARLLAALIALLALVCLVVGAATVAALNGFLRGELDSQLRAAGERSSAVFRGPPDDDERPEPGRNDPLGFLRAGQTVGTVGVRIEGGQVEYAGVLNEAAARDRDAPLAPVPRAAWPVLARLPVDGSAHTRDLAGLGDYRLLATTAAGGEVLVIGLPLEETHHTVYRLALAATLVAAAGLLVAALAGAEIVRRTLRPLNRVAVTATRVSELTLHEGEVALAERVPEADTDERTEVGRVGAALNRMLGHVGAALAARHASETRMRQFLADASHELRTPLAAIRGYAELTRRSRHAAPPDLAHAMRRVESETARMTTLVEDLLLLARLDSGRPLEAEPVDLSRLLVDAVSDAHAAGPEHRWNLDVADEPVTVTGDRARLHQVLANLLANARTHTPAGTTVTAGLSTRDGYAVLRVADDGPGIPAALLPEVFERFARGDNSRSRGAGSTGLGLSIVAAVVEAHRGTVEVASEPGRTVFTVTVPAATGPAPTGPATPVPPGAAQPVQRDATTRA